MHFAALFWGKASKDTPAVGKSPDVGPTWLRIPGCFAGAAIAAYPPAAAMRLKCAELGPCHFEINERTLAMLEATFPFEIKDARESWERVRAVNRRNEEPDSGEGAIMFLTGDFEE